MCVRVCVCVCVCVFPNVTVFVCILRWMAAQLQRCVAGTQQMLRLGGFSFLEENRALG